MKFRPLLLIFGLLAIPAILIGVYSAVSAPLPEGFPPPTPTGKIEVKHYPAYRSVTVSYEGQLSQATNAAFDPLYRHISTNNIAMTAPVEARYPLITLQEGRGGKPDERGQAEVSFLYRSKDIHPQQIAPGTKVEDHEPMTVVSIGIQGNYSYASYQQHLEQLREWLAQHSDYTVAGPPRRFFYDSPFIPDALKRSEVQIPIRQAAGQGQRG
jgi:effector-binding domain-containing protein